MRLDKTATYGYYDKVSNRCQSFKGSCSFAAVVAARAGRDGQFVLRNGLWLIVIAYLNHRPLPRTRFLGNLWHQPALAGTWPRGKVYTKRPLKNRILGQKGEVIASRIEVSLVAIDRRRAGSGHGAGHCAGKMLDEENF